MPSSEHLPKNAQPGITEHPREHLVLAALNFQGSDSVGCHAAMEALRSVIREELAGHPSDQSVETGELGYVPDHDDYMLLVTLAISTSGYDRLGASPERRPVDLQPIPADVLDPSGQSQGAEIAGEGDVLLHITSDDIYVVEHVLRRVEHELPTHFSVLWAQTGAQRYNTRQSDARKESRALIGFLDGTANLNMKDEADRALVFIDHTRTGYPPLPTPDQYAGATFPTLRPPPAQPEPIELNGGSYLALEVMLTNTTAWDQQPTANQEAIVGRQKVSGEPVAAVDPKSHVQKSNPHRPGTDDELRRMLRRGYSLIRPVGSTLGRGLIFIAFARSLSTQAEFVRRAWINNPNFPTQGAGLDALLFGGWVNPRLVVGGYYFVPPLAKASDETSWVVPAAG